MRPLRLALISLLLGGAAQGTLFQTLTLSEQAKKADVIVQATIGTPTTATEGGQTYAVYPLKVSETLAGDAATLPQTVGSQDGNGPALYVLSGVDSAPTFQAGQEAVLLLYKGRLDSPLVGYNQGAYLISGGLVSPLVSPLAAAGGTSATQASGGSLVPGQTSTQTGAQAGAQAPALSTAGQPVIGQTAVPTTPTASTVPGTASDASAASSNQAATRAAALNPATAAPGISTTVAGTAVPTGSLPATAPLAATTTPPATTGSAAASGTTGSSGTVTPSSVTPGSATPGTATSGTATSSTATSSTATSSTGTSATATGTPAASGSGSAASPSPASTAPSAQPVTVPNGVLGTIRTPAQLKAAIVAARAAK